MAHGPHMLNRLRSLSLGERLAIGLAFASLVAGVGIGLLGWRLPQPAPHTHVLPLAKLMQSQQTSCFRDDAQHPDATLTFGGLRASSGNSQTFVQCGNTHTPGLANGTYYFGFRSFPTDSVLTAIKARVGVDEGSSRSQIGTRAAWIVKYDRQVICWANATFRHPHTMDCQTSIEHPDLTKLSIVQRVTPHTTAPEAGLWVGMIDLTIELQEH